MEHSEITNLVLELNPKKEDCIITISIPSYNRLDNLTNVLLAIDKCAGINTCVCVVDNCSIYNYDVEFLKKNITRVNIKFYLNKYHLGPDASVLRAIEIPDTPWIYLLGDSKLPDPSSLKMLEDDCLTHSDAMGIVYRFRNSTNASVDIRSIAELKKNITDIGDLFLGGNSLISREAIKKYFSTATMYTLTRMPHILFHLMALHDGKVIHVSKNRLIKTFLPKPPHYNPGLSLIECWSQFGLILALPLSKKELKIVNDLILKMEDFLSIIVMCKFCLLQIFRHKRDIRPNLLRVIKYRYLYASLSYEKIFIYSIYFVSLVCTPFLVAE